MKLVFLLLCILLGPYFALSLLNTLGFWASTPQWRGKLCVSIVFLFTGVAHFFVTSSMVRMLPAWVGPREWIVYLSGVLEIAGAIGIWVPGVSHVAGICLVILLVAVLPANIYTAINRIDVGGQGGGPLYLLIRVPLQGALIAWVWYFTVRPVG